MAITRNSKDVAFDYALLMKDAGLVAASAAAQVSGSDKILDLGLARFDGRAIVDISAVEVGTGNERFRVIVQVSNSATFASGVFNAAEIQFGDSSVTLESADTEAARRQELAFCNEINGTLYRYCRLYTEVAGTIATGINYAAFLAQKA